MHDDRAISGTPTTTVLVRISGRVQGVGYRDWTRRRAQELHLSGWVRNRSDGTVEALFHGAPENVDAVLEACGKGPLFARVADVALSPAEPPQHGDFRELPTA